MFPVQKGNYFSGIPADRPSPLFPGEKEEIQVILLTIKPWFKMIYLFIAMILLSAFPLALTIWRIRKTAFIKKNGTHINGTVTGIRTIRFKNTHLDMVYFEYQDRLTGRSYPGKLTSGVGKYHSGDRVPMAYLPSKPASYAVDTKGGYTAMLIFTILVFAFVIFAVYKLNQMV